MISIFLSITFPFSQLMDGSTCDCKPDCNSTDYSVVTNSAPFRCSKFLKDLDIEFCARTCDSKNLNMSPLCDLKSGLEPSLWQEEVVNTYEAAAGNNGSIPQYVKVNHVF